MRFDVSWQGHVAIKFSLQPLSVQKKAKATNFFVITFPLENGLDNVRKWRDLSKRRVSFIIVSNYGFI